MLDAPLTAGLVALIYSLDISFTPGEVEQFIFSTAKDLGDSLKYGYGRIDAAAAVQKANSTPSPSPVFSPTVTPSPSSVFSPTITPSSSSVFSPTITPKVTYIETPIRIETPTRTATCLAAISATMSPQKNNNTKISVYPNPANANITFDISSVEGKTVCIIIYNIAGEKISKINAQLSPGINTPLTWHCRQIAAGIYFILISIDKQKPIIIKTAILH